jgi:class 3 adenylate cyclase/CheY-like chemotaxis protein
VSSDTAWAAHLRHELRTPLNHVVGYSEMLLEDLADAGPAALVAGLRRVHANARVVQARINSQLGSMWDDAGTPDLKALAEALATPLQQMLADIEAARELGAESVSARVNGDIARIAAAAAALSQLADGTLALEPPSGAAPGATAKPALPPTAIEGGRILVVDDDTDNRDILTRWLKRDGHQVIEASGGRQALQLLRLHPVDLMLLDMMMPDMDGMEVLATLAADTAAAKPPVLMISGYDEMHSVVRCIEAGAEDYLPKPLDHVLMRARIGASLERKRLRDRVADNMRELGEWNRRLEQRVAEQVSLLERLGRLKRFFSPQLAELIVAGGADDPLQTHRREVAVCFLDLRGFTTFAEVAEPEEVMAVLREYQAEMGRIIIEHEGTLERFTGDGMMIFFNDPVPVPDAAARAVRMAIDMRQRVGLLVERWRKQGYQLELGIGISQGYATIGAIGFEGRWDYGAIGSVTNLAARLCGEAGPGQTLMSQRVWAATEGLARSRKVGDLQLKGFARPLPAYELLGLQAGE